MNNCPKCGKPLNGANVCPYCQTQVNTKRENKIMKKKTNDFQIDTSRDLTEAFVGEKYANFYNTNFSVWALLFGIFYVWYRKMYLLFFIWLLVTIGSVIAFFKLRFIAYIIYVIISIVMALKFNSLYAKHVYKKIDNIKKKNQGKDQQELMYICTKKGGTTIMPYVFAVLIPIALIFVAIPLTNKYLNESRKQSFVEDAERAVDVVKTDVITAGISEEKVYDIEDINMLLEKRLEKSPFGKKYDRAMIKVRVTDNGYTYFVCLMDESNNGFTYTDSKKITTETVVLKNDKPSCE